MDNPDELLQKKLADLESGSPLEDVLRDLPEEARELSELLSLVSSLRGVEHPAQMPEQVTLQRQQVLDAAERGTLPAARSAARTVPRPAAATFTRPRRSWFNLGLFAAAGAALMILIVVTLTAASARRLDSAQVEYVTGQVQIAANRDATRWKNIAAGSRDYRGDRLRTLGASSATLVFAEGTRTFIWPNAELAFHQLDARRDGQIRVRIEQKSGETWNQVTPLKGADSYFLVDTPSGTASVHGTSFTVRVGQSGQAQFAVRSGEVQVTNDRGEVTLLPGQATASEPDGPIAAPSYQFTTQGSLLSIDTGSGAWNVSGMEFEVSPSTMISGVPELADRVRVTGRILEGSRRVADSITVSGAADQAASFTGVLEQNETNLWQVGGTPVQITGETLLGPGLALGMPVVVSFNIQDDGSWVAERIEALVNGPEQAEPSRTATADPQAMPSYQFEPQEITAASCGARDLNLSGSLRNIAGDANDYAANVQLGYLIDQGGEYVDTVVITPGSWPRLDAGQTVNFVIHVTLNENWEKAAESEQVKLRIALVSATNRPGHLNGRLAVTIERGCQETPTPPQATTPSQAGTSESDQPTQPAKQPESGLCTGAAPQPTGLKLAQHYGVPYETIMYWFCQNYGFGEIELAYSLSVQTGTPVEEIFAMHAQGASWGDIRKQLLKGSQPEKKDNDQNNKDKNNKPDKKKP